MKKIASQTFSPKDFSVGLIQEMLVTLCRFGFSPDMAKHITNAKTGAAEMIVKITQGGDFDLLSISMTSLNPEWLRARTIMGKNFFGVEEAISYFKVNPTHYQLAVLSEIPFSEAILNECKDTHVLVAKFPLSILEIRDKAGQKLFRSHENAWYNKQFFAKEQGEVGWQLVRKTSAPNSINKTWNEQQVFLNTNDEVPTAQTMVYTIIGYYLATGERLYEHVYIRTSLLVLDSIRVILGYFHGNSLDIDHIWDGYARSSIGLSVSRKS